MFSWIKKQVKKVFQGDEQTPLTDDLSSVQPQQQVQPEPQLPEPSPVADVVLPPAPEEKVEDIKKPPVKKAEQKPQEQKHVEKIIVAEAPALQETKPNPVDPQIIKKDPPPVVEKTAPVTAAPILTDFIEEEFTSMPLKQEPEKVIVPTPEPVVEKPALISEPSRHPERSVAESKDPSFVPPLQKKSWLMRMKEGLAKSSSKLTSDIKSIITKRKLDQDALNEIEDILILGDVGVATASKYIAKLKSERFDKEVTDEEVRTFLADQMTETLSPYAVPLSLSDHKPHVVLMVGVNGTGKTTTIGKMAQKLRNEGASVMVAAGDTFRAAANEQLKVWADRTGAIFMSKEQGGDAAALAFDALALAKKEGVDVLLIDTAGRLHNKTELMDELKKVVRVLKKQDETVPHDTVLVLDATTGQNAYAQLKAFQDMVNVSGLIITKLDGTAKGGVVVGLADQFKLPIHAIGVGETVDDLQNFDAKDFAKGLMGLN